MKLKILSVIFFFIILSGSVSSYSVEPVWDYPIYRQGDLIQFVINGDTNQTNISAKLIYYHDYDPIENLNETSGGAMEWFSSISVNESGIGIFRFILNETNGIEQLGFYNLTFIFGEDLQNETGVEYYTAPRAYTRFEVKINEQYLIDETRANNKDSSDNVDRANKRSDDNWIIMFWFFGLVTLVFFWALYVVHWHSKKDITIRRAFWDKVIAFYNKINMPLGDLYPMINSDNMKELKMIGLGLLGKQERHLMKRRNFHKAKYEHFDNKLKRSMQDMGIVLGDLLKKDQDDPHAWILRQHSDSTIQLDEGEIAFTPTRTKRYKIAKSEKVVKSDN
jgi:hypothetical protein